MLRNRAIVAWAIVIVLAGIAVALGLSSSLLGPRLPPASSQPGPSQSEASGSSASGTFGPGAAGVPNAVAGLPVLSVGDALALRDAGSSQRVAVFGWAVRFYVPCAQQPNPYQPLEDCVHGFTWLMAGPEELVVRNPDGSGSIHPPVGLAFNTTYDPADPAVPQAVVVIGRFHDPRSSLCPPGARRDACGRLFVAEGSAWLGPTSTAPTSGGQAPSEPTSSGAALPSPPGS